MIGIVLGEYIRIPFLEYGLYLCMPILVYLAVRKGKMKFPYFGIVAFVSLLFLGYALVVPYHERQVENSLDYYINKETIEWIGVVQSMPAPKKNIEADIELESIRKDGKWIKANGKIKVYFKRDTTSIDLEYGDKIIASSIINTVQESPNPKSFNYAKYLRHQGIHHTTFVKEETSKLLDQNQGNPIWGWSYATRKKALTSLKKYLTSTNEFAVGSALILGYKDEITEEVQDAYSRTGAMHVLAVSGLHVGILFLFVSFIFNFYKGRNPIFPWIKLFVSLLLIWGFALITGASPSVLRAATMFSFVAVGDTLDRNKNIYNTLAASAFLLLCVNPYFIFSPGFQLSYLAVIGIVFFQPIIYKSWYVKNKLGNYIWQLMSVSLAAQIATIPISLYYFHQFPSYFLLSGLVVIPAASLIMVSGIAMILVNAFPALEFISSLLGDILYWVIWLVNAIIFFIGKLPFNLIENIYISFHEMILGYIVTGLLMVWFSTEKTKYLQYAIIVLAFIAASYATRNIYHQSKEEIVFYNTKGTVIDFLHQGKRTTFTTEDIIDKNENFAANGYRVATGYSKESEEGISLKNSFLQIGDKRFYILSENYYDILSMNQMDIDGIIIQNNPFINFAALTEEFNFDFIIADGSNYEKNVAKWRAAFDTSHTSDIPFYFTKEKAIILQN